MQGCMPEFGDTGETSGASRRPPVVSKRPFARVRDRARHCLHGPLPGQARALSGEFVYDCYASPFNRYERRLVEANVSSLLSFFTIRTRTLAL
jgi:hypothetical protein